jgi:hypothetical protein
MEGIVIVGGFGHHPSQIKSKEREKWTRGIHWSQEAWLIPVEVMR